MFYAQSLSHVQLFVNQRSVARQVPLFVEFSRQEYWNGLSLIFSRCLDSSEKFRGPNFLCMKSPEFQMLPGNSFLPPSLSPIFPFSLSLFFFFFSGEWNEHSSRPDSGFPHLGSKPYQSVTFCVLWWEAYMYLSALKSTICWQLLGSFFISSLFFHFLTS